MPKIEEHRIAVVQAAPVAFDTARTLAKAALVQPGGAVDEAYYRAQVSVADERLALAGLRLAAVLNRSLTMAPPAR